MGEPCSPPSAPSRRDGFVPKGAPPPSVSSPPCLCSLLHRPRKVGIHLGGETPDAPASLRSGLLGAEAGAPGGRAGQGARAGNGPGAPLGRGPLAGPGHSRGPHRRPRGLASALRPAGVAGAEAGRAVFYEVRWPNPSPPQESLPWAAWRSPRDPRRRLGRGAPAGLVICAPGIHISNVIFGAASTARRRRRALTTASACCVFFIWGWFAQGLPAGLLCRRGRPSTSAPCVLLSDAPVAPPNPAGPTRRADFFLSFFQTRAAAAKPGMKLKSPGGPRSGRQPQRNPTPPSSQPPARPPPGLAARRG